MSLVTDRARVTILLADHAVVDASGKINALGVGWTLTSVDPQTGTTAPQTLVVAVDVPPDLYGEDFDLTVVLVDADGAVVTMPSADGSVVPLRISQHARADEPVFAPELNVPRRTAWAHTQVIVNFPMGLTLRAGQSYRWSASIDGRVREEWSVGFYVPAPRPAPVFGAPVGPSDLPVSF